MWTQHKNQPSCIVQPQYHNIVDFYVANFCELETKISEIASSLACLQAVFPYVAVNMLLLNVSIYWEMG